MSTAAASEAPRLLGPRDVRELVERYGVRPTKQHGQNFVIDPNTVRRIVRTAAVRPDDVVLEVGPGLGSLTLGLVDVAARVVAVEVDTALAEGLSVTIAERAPNHADRVSVLCADAMRISVVDGEAPTAVVANLPYNVAVPVLLHVLATFPTVERLLVMVQREVAERLAAEPGSKNYGVPSVKMAWYTDVHLAGPVPRSVFWPMPRVDSALVAMHRRDPPNTPATRQEVFAVVDQAFAQRRKMMRTALTAQWPPPAVEEALTAAGIDPAIRAERLTVQDFARLAASLRP